MRRETLARWFVQQILPLAEAECFTPQVRVNAKNFPDYGCDYGVTADERIDITFTRPNAPDPEVIKLSWYNEAYDSAGLDGVIGSLKVRNQYDATIRFEGNRVIVRTDGRIYLEIKNMQSRDSGNICHQVYDDVYTFNNNSQGGVNITYTSSQKDFSQNGSNNWLSELSADDNAWLQWLRQRRFTTRQIQRFPIFDLQEIYFPGGRTFAFKECYFSDNQDLIAGITYSA